MRTSFFPILFLNQPIKKEKQDVFHLDVQAKELKKAVDSGANFIGVISDYGGGKSSTVQTFAKHGKYDICNICLWGYTDRRFDNEKNPIAVINQSFLYQFSKTVNKKNFSWHINRMISTNYKTISWSSNLTILHGLIGILFFFFCMAVLLAEKIYGAGEPLSENFTKIIRWMSYLHVIIPYCVYAIILLLLANNTIAFSWHKDDIKRSFSEADAFEIFSIIINRTNHCKKNI